MTFTPTGTVVFEVNPPALIAGTDFDQFIVNGVLDLSGAVLASLARPEPYQLVPLFASSTMTCRK